VAFCSSMSVLAVHAPVCCGSSDDPRCCVERVCVLSCVCLLLQDLVQSCLRGVRELFATFRLLNTLISNTIGCSKYRNVTVNFVLQSSTNGLCRLSLCSRLGTGAQCIKKKISFGTFRCFARDGTRTIVSGAARRAKVLLSAPSNSQPFARHVRRRCIREFVRAG
jgi:hypothetical protein